MVFWRLYQVRYFYLMAYEAYLLVPVKVDLVRRKGRLSNRREVFDNDKL